MKTRRFTLLFALLLSFATSHSFANPASQALGTCMVDSLTGKERKMLAQWIFFAIAAHPEIQGYSNVSAQAKLDTDKKIGALITRLIADDCPEQARKAQAAGSQAFESAFELVGRVAMQELMTNTQVNQAISGFEKYLDTNKLNSAFRPAGTPASPAPEAPASNMTPPQGTNP